ncbi:MAG: hypothetical protein JW918_07360 [Anaerolineae bacterium]|nr:hypothetical protein [Anaerolineae bacterium]
MYAYLFWGAFLALCSALALRAWLAPMLSKEFGTDKRKRRAVPVFLLCIVVIVIFAALTAGVEYWAQVVPLEPEPTANPAALAQSVRAATTPEGAADSWVKVCYGPDPLNRQVIGHDPRVAGLLAVDGFADDLEVVEATFEISSTRTLERVTAPEAGLLYIGSEAENYKVDLMGRDFEKDILARKIPVPIQEDLAAVWYPLAPMKIANGEELEYPRRRAMFVVVRRFGVEGLGETARQTWKVVGVVVYQP